MKDALEKAFELGRRYQRYASALSYLENNLPDREADDLIRNLRSMAQSVEDRFEDMMEDFE